MINGSVVIGADLALCLRYVTPGMFQKILDLLCGEQYDRSRLCNLTGSGFKKNLTTNVKTYEIRLRFVVRLF